MDCGCGLWKVKVRFCFGGAWFVNDVKRGKNSGKCDLCCCLSDFYINIIQVPMKSGLFGTAVYISSRSKCIKSWVPDKFWIYQASFHSALFRRRSHWAYIETLTNNPDLKWESGEGQGVLSWMQCAFVPLNVVQQSRSSPIQNSKVTFRLSVPISVDVS